MHMNPDGAPSDNEHLDSSNAIWDDGEWISWDEINRHISKGKDAESLKAKSRPTASVAEKLQLLDDLLSEARDLDADGKRERINFGEIGELYAEIRHGLKRHRKYAEGSDGKIGKDFVEVKTITPWKTRQHVAVKRRGHFSKLVIVRIDQNFMIDSRMISRSALNKGKGGKVATLSWAAAREPKEK